MHVYNKVGVTKKEAYEWIRGTVGTGAIGKPYLYCIAFSDEYLKRKYDSETFEVLKGMYIQEFNSRLRECGLKGSDFYEYKDDMLYVKNVSDKVIKSVTEYVKKEVAFDFRTSGSVESKVENCKNVLSELILEATGKFVDGYDYDDFTDEKKIRNGSSFALIPFIEENGQLKSLSPRDASKINGVFNKEIPNVDDNFISDIRGKTANPQFANCKEPVYAFSNKQIAQLLPKIMRSPITYNEISGSFEFAVDLENFKRRGSSRSSSTVTSPTHAGSSGLRTTPNPKKGNRDSGLGDSPPRPEDSVAQSSSSDPRSSFEEIQEPQSCFPRQGALLYHNVGAAEVVAAENVQAGTSAWSQLMNPYLSQGTSGNKWQPLLQFPGPGFSDSSGKGAVQNVQAGSSASSRWSSQSTSSGFSDSLWTQSGSSSNKRPDSTHSADSGYSGSLERPQPNSSITTSAVPGISESGKGSNVAAVPVDNKRPQSLPLTENTPKPSSESPKKIIQQFLRNFSIRRSKTNGKATKDILQFDKEKFSSFSSGMQKVLSLPLSLDMIRNLFPHFPIEKWEKLILLARSEKVKKSHSSPKKIEQLLSSLLPEEQEICSLLFFPDRKNETYVDLSPGTREQMVLFWELLRGQEFTEESGIFSGSSSQGSVSSELKHPQQVKHMSEALGK